MILDEFVKLTGYNRCYASYLLRMYEKRAVLYTKGKKDRLYTNFSLPSMKLIEKVRAGSKVTKRYV